LRCGDSVAINTKTDCRDICSASTRVATLSCAGTRAGNAIGLQKHNDQCEGDPTYHSTRNPSHLAPPTPAAQRSWDGLRPPHAQIASGRVLRRRALQLVRFSRALLRDVQRLVPRECSHRLDWQCRPQMRQSTCRPRPLWPLYFARLGARRLPSVAWRERCPLPGSQ